MNEILKEPHTASQSVRKKNVSLPPSVQDLLFLKKKATLILNFLARLTTKLLFFKVSARSQATVLT